MAKKKIKFWDRFSPYKKERARLDDYGAELKMREKRIYEATQIHKDMVRSEPPNQRNHWQGKDLRDQARHLYENDPIARRVVDSIVSNMIGDGIKPMAESQSDLLRDIVQKYLDKWTECTDCDWDQSNSIMGLQSLIVKALVRDGAVFVHKVYNRKKLRLQVLEIDYLDNWANYETDRGGEVVNGIEFDRFGQIIAYHIYEHHPDDMIHGLQLETPDPRSISTGYRGRGGKVIRIRAEDICHLRRVDRPNQMDGHSWLAPALLKIWDLREYEEAKLIQQKIQCSFTGFIEDNFSLTEEEREDLLGNVEDGDPLTRSVRPGTIEELPAGKTVSFPAQASTPNEEFVERCLRSIAGAVGVSYEIFNDYSKVNFSSGRMGFLEMDRQMKHYSKSILMPQLFEKINNWIFDHLIYIGKIPRGSDLSIKWVLPVREMIDPDKETNTIMKLVGANLISYQEAHAMLGKNFKKNLGEIIANRKLYTENELPLLGVQQNQVTQSPYIAYQNAPPEDQFDEEGNLIQDESEVKE